MAASSQREDPAPSATAARLLMLEEEVRSLTEELSQCQADKEFVWSLWKRLQVANPDLGEAVSLVVEREKQKVELKDRKVLEILQVKDDKIQTLEQRTSGQQEEINNLVKRKIAVDEENTFLNNALSDLQQKFNDKIQELKDTKESALKKEEQSRLVIKNLEEENKGFNTRYADLLNDLEKLRKQEAQWRIEKSGIDAKIKDLETDLTETKEQMESLRDKCKDLASQLEAKQAEVKQKNLDVVRIKKELHELQNLYKQNTEHAAQQAELIQQLQALNMDTQEVLKTQEDAHTAETISYQNLYSELSICYEKLKASETRLQQNVVYLENQLLEKEEFINQLEEQLQHLLSSATSSQETFSRQSEQVRESTSSQTELLQSKEFTECTSSELEYLITSQNSEITLLQEKLKRANRTIADHSLCCRHFLDCACARAGKKHKKPPVKRSRSLSPMSVWKESDELRKLKIAEKKIENLERLLQLKIQENDDLRQAHEKRKKRLQMLQTNYRAVKKQLKQWEEGYGTTGSSKIGMERSDPQRLCQEDSDAVWNELAYFKKEHKKILIEKINLEEELDQMKVRVSMDQATLQEMNVCLQQERQELLFRLGEEDEVRNSTPKKNVKEISAETLQKVSQLERRLKKFEKESYKLREANKDLTKDKNDLRASLKQHREELQTKEKDLEKLHKKITEIKKDKEELLLIMDRLEREIASLKRQVADANILRSEHDDLLCQVQHLQCSLDEARIVGTIAAAEVTCWQCRSRSAKVKQKTGKRKNIVEHHQSFKVVNSVYENFNKDGWEDMSECSDYERPVSDYERPASDYEMPAPEMPTSELPASEVPASEILITEIPASEIPTSVAASQPIVSTDSNYNLDQNNMEDDQMLPSSMDLEGLEGSCELYHKKSSSSDIIASQLKKSSKSAPTSKVNREKKRNTVAQKPTYAVPVARRVSSLQQQLTLLQNSKTSAVSSLKKAKEINKKLTSQLHQTAQKLQASKQTVQTLTSNLSELQREKSDLQGKLDHLTQSTKQKEGLSPVTSGHTGTTPAAPQKNVELEMKQLQCKLKNSNNEITKQSSIIKSLKNEVQGKEEQMRELQEKISRMERDISMKRHLIEDWRLRIKGNQEKEKTFNETLQTLEEKVKALTEECSTKKASIDSLKQRLNVVTKEKSQYEQIYHNVKDELEKKESKLSNLEGKMAEAEHVMTKLETTASQQLHGLARQSEHALEVVQKKLSMSSDKVEEFITFVKTLAAELQNQVKEWRTRIRCTKKLQQEKENDCGISKVSIHRAQNLAASILNISKTDLDDILNFEGDEESEEMKAEFEGDKEWMSYLQKLLEGQFPFASYLMDAVLEKLNEQKKLIEEYCCLMKHDPGAGKLDLDRDK